MTSDDRKQQLRYARALLQRGRYGEIVKRTVAAMRAELERLLGRSDEEAYRRWLRLVERDAAPRWSPPAGDAPLISLLMPAGGEERIAFTVSSLRRQSYGEWELLYAGRARLPNDDRLRSLPGDLQTQLEAARGRLVAMVMPGDALLPRALEQALEALWARREAPMVYTDEGLLDATGAPLRPRFKPDWSPDLLLGLPYTGQLSLFRREAVERAGGFSARLQPMAALYDLTLRVTEQAPPVHARKLVYQRRLLPPSPVGNEWVEVVRAALARRGVEAEVAPGAAGRTSVTVRRAIADRPSVAIVIPFRNRLDLLERCLRSIRERSSYPRYQIVLVDNASDDRAMLAFLEVQAREPDVRLLRYPHRFNFAAINNWAVEQVDAEQVLLLNNDTEVASADWIEALLEHAQRPEVGIVGARLLYPDGRLQHAGVVLGLRGLAGHPFDGWPDGGVEVADAVGHGGEVMAVRNVSAVTAACAMIRRPLWLEVGGMDAERFAVSFNDVDLCLKLRARGLQVVYTPHCRVIHHTSASRELRSNLAEDELLRARWAHILDDDPYYNPNLSLRTAYRPRFCEKII